MIASCDTAAVPAQMHAPAGCDTFLDARRTRAPRIALRPSWALHALLLAGVLIATTAFFTTFAPWLGAWRALPPALALGVAGLLAFQAWRRAQPAFVEIGADRFAAFARTGVQLVDGRLLGASQWGAALLALVVEEGGRRKMLLVAADSLDAETFRILAVSARSASGR
ncbi:protein YgfX [Paraburkholderia sacchari]|uniref:Lipoprotein n=1 Tax=Paraburkholderia sacchari TaxID=159450 RepID=A0A8T6ZE19_9BURK|nr:protein YgfX [Paraburkholderia sacchari]NLP62464.1 hypothetical protein [Paraburkholderia sacchari]